MPPKRKPDQVNNKSNTSKGKNNYSTDRATVSKPFQPKRNGTQGAMVPKRIPQWRMPKHAASQDYKDKIETLWKSMTNEQDGSRVRERKHAIQNGLIADPKKRTTLANAIRVVGICQDMCPEFERIQRIRENAVDRAEKITLNNGNKVPDELRMVKAFHRPDAGKEEQLPSDLRPPFVLQKSVRYLLDKVASPSSSLAEHHKYVWDRTRCIRNDFTIQASSRLEDIKIAIECYEEIARFHILSQHQMPKIGKEDYDAQQELEQLSATLLTLFEFYDDNRGKYEAPREAEFRAYKLIIDIRSRSTDMLERVQTWPPRVRDSLQVQTAVQLCQASGQVFTTTSTLLSPYGKAIRVEQAQYDKFWSILESPKVDYLMACAAAVSFNEVRVRILDTMVKVYRSGPQSKLHDFSLEELTYALGFDNKSQLRKLIRETGLHVSRNNSGTSYLDLDESASAVPKAAIAAAPQFFSRSIVEVKREDRVFSAIYKGLKVDFCRQNGLIDRTAEDPDFEPDPEDMDSEDEEDGPLFVDGNEDEDMNETNQTEPVSMFANSASLTASKRDGSMPAQIPRPSTNPFGSFGQSSFPKTTNDAAAGSSTKFTAPSLFTKDPSKADPFPNASIIPAGTSFGTISGQKTFEAISAASGNASASSATTVLADDAALPSNSATSSASSNPVSTSAITQGGNKLTTPLLQFNPIPSSPATISSSISNSASSPSLFFGGSQNTRAADHNGSSARGPLHPFVFPTQLAAQGAVSGSEKSGKATTQSLFETKLLPAQPGAISSSSDQKALAPAPGTLFPTAAPALISPPSSKLTFAETGQSPKAIQQFSLFNNASVLPAASPIPTDGFQTGSLQAGPVVTEVAKPPRPVVTQKQKDDVLNAIARDLVLGKCGILEQFLEAELAPIYDKAQRLIVKERTFSRLDDIKNSLLGSKYLFVWKQRSDEKIRKRRIASRRKRIRQSQIEASDDQMCISSKSESLQGDTGTSRSLNALEYLNRGFHNTFDASISARDVPTSYRRRASALSASGTSQVFTTDGAPSRSSTVQSEKRNGHSRSHTVDNSSRATSISQASSSMPPPTGLHRTNALIKSNASESKPFIGNGYLQNPTLRREAVDFARRTGPSTTTSSNYFRLKARRIDPSTGSIPLSRKRARDSSGHFPEAALSMSRRSSISTTSTVSLSESTRDLLARAKLSDSTRALLDGRHPSNETPIRGTTTPKYTVDEDELFTDARKLGQTMREDIAWMQSVREEREKQEQVPKETPAQKRLREFKATPSKTSVRLRQTLANGLLPADFFEKQDVANNVSTSKTAAFGNRLLDTPTPKMSLAAMLNEQDEPRGRRGIGGLANSRGASADDAIEL